MTIKILTKKFCEPLWLIVMFHSNRAGIEEDEDNDEPEPGRGFADASDKESESFFILPKLWIGTIFGRRACNEEKKALKKPEEILCPATEIKTSDWHSCY